MSDDVSGAGDASQPEFLPVTAYAVLGLLAVNREELSPSEIKVRADWALRNFYWSPAVSHIRKELERLLELKLVEERVLPMSKARSSRIYQSTAKGEAALARWVSESPTEESVVLKNSVLLKVFLADSDSEDAGLRVIDARLAEVDEAIRRSQWGYRRTVELGISENPSFNYPMAVNAYVLRSLYFEQGNLRQLRDTILGFDVEAFHLDETVERLPIRPRRDSEGD